MMGNRDPQELVEISTNLVKEIHEYEENYKEIQEEMDQLQVQKGKVESIIQEILDKKAVLGDEINKLRVKRERLKNSLAETKKFKESLAQNFFNLVKTVEKEKQDIDQA